MKKTLSVVCLTLSLLSLSAQNNYKPGLIVRNNGDTVRGWINYGNWRRNPRKIEFRSTPEDKPAKYTVREIQYFTIPGEDVYQRAATTVDMRSVRPEDITKETPDSVVQDTIFLRLLVKGPKLNLYELIDEKKHYYVQQPGGDFRELGFRMNAGKWIGEVYEQDDFKDQLRKYAPENDMVLFRRIGSTRYMSVDLSKTVIALNGAGSAPVTNNAAPAPGGISVSNDVVWMPEAAKRNKVRTEFFGTVGAEYAKLSFSGDVVYSPEVMNYKASVSPVIGAGMDILAGRNLNDITVRLELTYAQHTHKGDRNTTNSILGYSEHETYTLTQRNISPALSLLYNFRRSAMVKFYAGAGVAYNLGTYTKNTYTLESPERPYYNDTTQNYLDLNNNWTAVFLRAGVRIGKKAEIGATANFIGRLTSYIRWSASPHTYSLRVTYFIF